MGLGRAFSLLELLCCLKEAPPQGNSHKTKGGSREQGENPGHKKPGQTEACPHTAAMEGRPNFLSFGVLTPRSPHVATE
ncbi:hypothetical protein PSEEN0765 [Pseudomonas entomophila L48]|uniref:Uncharacterized protein n=1 Tax=Pseudomonas entomophila (strain L48) TaxID=384676 RepID=Q1IF71_PSEE4|nr:hypothetical protein PSEEN0765 [Pseudomonas entomophila L48]